MTPKDRFTSPSELIDALLEQKLVRGNRALAEAIAEDGELIEFPPGRLLIKQDDSDRVIYFLLSGKAKIIINGVRLYDREAGVTVGEMSAVNPAIRRAASIEANETTVAWKITHERLHAIANVELWQRMAIDLASRLEQRNRLINRANARPNVFIICSAEAHSIARALRIGLQHYAEVEIWSDDKIFPAGGYPIEALETQVNNTDFGIALAEPDDLVLSRDRQSATPRDNVIFELGFFMSRLGRHRSLLLVPHGGNVRLPSDFKGLTPIPYNKGTGPSDIAKAMGPTIDRIAGIIEEKGVRASILETS